MIMLGWGPQRARGGESSVWAVWALACRAGRHRRKGHGNRHALPLLLGRRSGVGRARPWRTARERFARWARHASRTPPEAPAGRLDQRRAPQPGKAYPLRRDGARLSRHPPRLLGGRQSVCAPARYGTTCGGLQTSRRPSSCATSLKRRRPNMPTYCFPPRIRSREATLRGSAAMPRGASCEARRCLRRRVPRSPTSRSSGGLPQRSDSRPPLRRASTRRAGRSAFTRRPRAARRRTA